ncbi:ABC transporter ATP-binding protein [Pseudobutyrivibrio xylanivorans]|uniref:ABC transporter ATP-binding protein n=1 Tax=Pseudobutyrivibrio xylanivorans TaxID=185007 RepID=A0A5P6VUI1_PSEXY|nr:ABC transporter ATP-binding protein [Pseudobutyrivibrio xylanivorans]
MEVFILINEKEILLSARNIRKSYYIGTPNELEILHGIDLDIRKGEFVSIVGQSGSGKSTLMNILGILDRQTSGDYTLNGTNISEAPAKELAKLRNKHIGFVFQTYNLIARTDALSNVEMPMLYAGISPKERRERAKELLEMVGMGERMHHTPDELSGGQKQRVAIARAMANDPDIILADEPTGALDSGTGRMVMDIFHDLHEKQGKTIVLITHSNELAAETPRIITISDGNIISEKINSMNISEAEPFERKNVC